MLVDPQNIVLSSWNNLHFLLFICHMKPFLFREQVNYIFSCLPSHSPSLPYSICYPQICSYFLFLTKKRTQRAVLFSSKYCWLSSSSLLISWFYFLVPQMPAKSFASSRSLQMLTRENQPLPQFVILLDSRPHSLTFIHFTSLATTKAIFSSHFHQTIF